MTNLKVHKFYPPYKPNGRTNFPKLKKRSGVYIIKENGKIVYIGSSNKNLYKTIYRHFQKWRETSHVKGGKILYHTTYKTRIRRNKYTIRVVITNTYRQALNLELMLVKKYKPRDNIVKYRDHNPTPTQQKILLAYQNKNVDPDLPF